jgi:hypothetical protein
MFVLAVVASHATSLPGVVVAGGVATVVLAVMTRAFVGDPYDLIGRGVFDRPRGDDGDRPLPDAEYEEWATAMAGYCAEQDDHEPAEPALRQRDGRHDQAVRRGAHEERSGAEATQPGRETRAAG